MKKKERIEKPVGCPNVQLSLVYGYEEKKSWQLADIPTKISRKFESENLQISSMISHFVSILFRFHIFSLQSHRNKTNSVIVYMLACTC